MYGRVSHEHYSDAAKSRCSNCKKDSYWINYDPTNIDDVGWRMVRPEVSDGPRPHPMMPVDVRRDYEEAQSIVSRSPRGAGALARLAAQKLVNELDTGSGDLNTKIGRMVKAGLPEIVQQSLDALRVVGNNAVHPGVMVLDDEPDTVNAVLECMNIVIEDRIARPKGVSRLFDRLPAGVRAAIQERDAKK